MKKFFSGFACTVFLFLSCNNGKNNSVSNTDNSTTQKNLDASRAINKAFETGDPGMIDSVVASNFIDHTDRGDMNRDSLKAMVKMIHTTNKDMKMDLIKELADSEYVFSLMRFRGTGDGAMMAAGPYDMRGLEVEKFKDGKVVEHWEYMEPAEVMKMMAKMPHTEMQKNDMKGSATMKK